MDEHLKEVYEKKNRWTFIHTYLKGMVLNTILTATHSNVSMKQPYVRSVDDINSTGLKEIYSVVNESYDEWLTEHEHQDFMKGMLRNGINLCFTILNEDWVYEKLMMMIYMKMGRSYAKKVLGMNEEDIMRRMEDVKNGR